VHTIEYVGYQFPGVSITRLIRIVGPTGGFLFSPILHHNSESVEQLFVKDLERRLAGSGPGWAPPQIEGARFRRILAFAGLFLAATLSSNQAAGQFTPTEKEDSMHGTVVNSVTHTPIPRALVSSPDNRFATMTDDEGHFEFTFPRASAVGDNEPENNANHPVALLARKPGFVRDSEFTAQDMSAKELTIALVPEALIVGKVSLPTAEPPDNIFLQIYRRQVVDGAARWVPAGGTQSRSDGEFRFADLPAGTYKVLTRELLDRDPLTFNPQGQLYGYPPAYSQNAPDFSSAGTIQVSAGMTGLANLTLVKQPYYRIHIPVANALPDTGLNVSVNPAGRQGPGFSLGYNNRDQAIEGMLPNGTYMIEASSFGQSAATGLLTFTVNGAAVQGPPLVLMPNSSVKVDVKEEFTSTDNTGSVTLRVNRRVMTPRGPRRYLNINLEPADDSERGGVGGLRNPTGPEDESLVIENVQPGHYWVRVNSSRGFAASVRSGNIDLQHQPLVVAAGGSASPIEITMRDDTAGLDGTVEGITPTATAALNASAETDGSASLSRPQAVPAAPARVYCVPLADSSGQFTEVWVSPDGSFSSPPLPPGAYRLLAFDRPQPELEYRNPEVMQSYEAKGPVVRLISGQTEHVRLQLISTSE
jgi:hypothetical protein